MLHRVKEEMLRQKLLDKIVKSQQKGNGLDCYLKNDLGKITGEKSRKKSKSGSKNKDKSSVRKRLFVQEGQYQTWTNAFARMSIHWDEAEQLLESEK